MLNPRVLVTVLVATALFFTALAPPSLGASADYDIDIAGSLDTVDRTVSTSYGEFTVTELGRASTGDSVTIAVDAPAAAEYTVTVVDGEQRIRRSRTATGDISTTFDTDGLQAGTYAVAVGNTSSDEVYAMEPLVVKAYNIEAQSNDTVATNDALDVSVELEQVESGEPVEAVQVVLAGGSNHVRVDATKESDSAYTATVPADSFDTGDYSLYAVVRSEDTALGENELVGVSDERTIEVVEATTDSGSTGTSGSTDSGSSAGGSDSSETTTETKTVTETETTNTATTTETETESTATATTTSETTTTAQTTETTTDSVLTPNEQTTSAQTTSSELPNTALQALFGVLVVFGVARRLRQN